ncbi:F390 synthetase-related protein, partial [Bacillus cereus]
MKIITLLQHYFSTKRNRNRFKSREELKAYQDRAVESLLKSLPSTNYYFEYNKIINGEGSNYDWRKFPVVDKTFLMDNFDKLNTAGITKEQAFSIAFKAEETRDFSPTINDITIGLSSGTSGNRGIFLVSPEERVKWAGTVLAKLLPSSLFHKQRIAFFLRANSNLYESTNGGRISFSFFDLLEETKILVEKLQAMQPTIVVAPPSMLRILAEAQESGNLHIRPLKLISVAEVLEPLDKKYIETVFSLKL